MPPLIRVDENENRAWLSWYGERTFRCLREEEVDPKLVDQFPYDRLMGYVAAEIRLNKMLKRTADSPTGTSSTGS
jgi:hypothetical protein